MININYRKAAAVGLIVTLMGCLSACQTGEVIDTLSKDNTQTEENGKEEKKTYIQTKTEGYDVDYSGRISGYSDYICVSLEDGFSMEGAGTFEWVTDSVVKVTFEKGKEKDNREYTVLADQSNVIIKMGNKTESVSEDKSEK